MPASKMQMRGKKISFLSRVAGKKSTKRTKSISGPLYIFRGRINTEVMEVENVEDGTGKHHACLFNSSFSFIRQFNLHMSSEEEHGCPVVVMESWFCVQIKIRSRLRPIYTSVKQLLEMYN